MRHLAPKLHYSSCPTRFPHHPTPSPAPTPRGSECAMRLQITPRRVRDSKGPLPPAEFRGEFSGSPVVSRGKSESLFDCSALFSGVGRHAPPWPCRVAQGPVPALAHTSPVGGLCERVHGGRFWTAPDVTAPPVGLYVVSHKVSGGFLSGVPPVANTRSTGGAVPG